MRENVLHLLFYYVANQHVKKWKKCFHIFAKYRFNTLVRVFTGIKSVKKTKTTNSSGFSSNIHCTEWNDQAVGELKGYISIE